MDKEKLFKSFKEYFELYFEFGIDFKLNDNIYNLINEHYVNCIKEYLDNQDFDIAELLNIDIQKYRNNKQYKYNLENILLSFVEDNKKQFKNIIQKIINERSKDINLEQIYSRLSKLICGHIYQLIPKIINNIKIKANIRNKLINLINAFIVDDIFCKENFNLSLSNILSLSPTINLVLENDFNELENYVIDIYDQLHIKDKNKYLLELDNDDKIGQYYGEINYDPHNTNLRDGPVVIYRDKNNKDHVLIGNYGDFHHELNTENCNYDNYHYGRAYWYKPCVFIDYQGQIGYTINELVNILKNDSRIKKVYLAPDGAHGGKLKRLAIKK